MRRNQATEVPRSRPQSPTCFIARTGRYVAAAALAAVACQGSTGGSGRDNADASQNLGGSAATGGEVGSGGNSGGTVTRPTGGSGGADAAAATNGGSPDAGTETRPLVFAHYMLANRDYGSSTAAYKRDIDEAIAAGIDGFALNLGSWRNGNYATDTALMYEAAIATADRFKLLFSPDMSGDLVRDEIVTFIGRYANHPAQARRGNKVLVSGYGFGGGDPAPQKTLWLGVRTDLAAMGVEIFLMPHAWIRGYLHQPSASEIQREWDDGWTACFDGFFYFGAAMLPFDVASDSLLRVGNRYATAAHDNGAVYMAPVSPQYWGRKQGEGRRYYEYAGGEGLENQWRTAMSQNAEFVELVTWNDFDEASYLSPIDDVVKYWPYVDVTTTGYYKSHAGLLALTAYFIDWYHRGGPAPAPPGGVDHLYFAYRTHPKDATASNDPRGPVTARIGDVQDVFYVTTLTIAAAELRVSIAGNTIVRPVPAGLHHERVPFVPGTPTFSLWRNGKALTSATGEPITANPSLYNFLYTTGTAP